MASTPTHSSSSSIAGTVVVPGNHDGVHLGHQALLARARELAAPRGSEVVALTFDPHPMATVAPERAPIPLTTIARRTELLLAAGADRVAVARFDAAYAAQTAEQWIDDELSTRLGARAVVVGVDFRFGKGRGGDVEGLRAMGQRRGIEVDALGEVTLAGGDERVSSTAIRKALAAGDVAHAAALLTRPHAVDGTVVEGNKRGRTIGYPTANLAPDPVLLPSDGVYAVRVRTAEGAWHDGMANLGTRPTFAAGRSLEAHLFDFAGDLYGARVRLAFVDRIRAEKKFDGVESLVAQIREDEKTARALCARTRRGAEG
ncbi:MAG: bifunctional riboflavin kinase/FAD synthetase [Sandaracinus sp.]